MMRWCGLVLVLLLAPSLRAQLSTDVPGHPGFLGAAAGAMGIEAPRPPGGEGSKGLLHLAVPVEGYATEARLFEFPTIHPAAGSQYAPSPTPFDFTRSAPHLAFFCRLEINEARRGVIPVRFRLGGHTYWQDQL